MMPLFGFLLSDIFDSLGSATEAPTTETAAAPVVDPASIDSLNQASLMLTIVGIAIFFAMVMARFGMQNAAARFMTAMKTEVLYVSLNQDCTFYDSTTTGRVSHVMLMDCTAVGDFIGVRLPVFLQTFAISMSAVGISFYEGWDLTLISFACLPILVVSVYLATKFSTKMDTKSAGALQDASAYAKSMLGNIRTVYSFDAGERSVQNYTEQLEPPLKYGLQASLAHGIQEGSIRFCAFAVFPLVLWYGGIQVVDGRYQGGAVFAVLSSLLMAYQNLSATAPLIKFIPAAAEAATQVHELLEYVNSKSSRAAKDMETLELTTATGEVSLENVRFSYPVSPDVEILHGISLTIPAGTSAALVGESGCGKSTIVSLLLRLYDPTSGRILFDGFDTRQITLESYRMHIGLVSQEPVLFNNSIAANIGYGKTGSTMEEIITAAKAAQIHDFIATLPNGYDTMVGEKGTQLSGGQKQRVAIARTILRAPKVFVLDEATSALDTQSERAIQDALQVLTAGSTTIAIAHRLSTIRDSSIIAVMDRGMIIEQGTHQELVAAQGAYSILVEKYEKAIEAGEPLGTILKQSASMRLSGSSILEQQVQSRELAAQDLMGSSFIGASAILMPNASGPINTQLSRQLTSGQLSKTFTTKSSTVTSTGLKIDVVEEEQDHEEEEFPEVPTQRFLSLLKPDRTSVLLAVASATIVGALYPCTGLTLTSIVSAYYLPSDQVMPAVEKWALIMTAIAVSTGIAAFVQGYLFSRIGQRLAFRLRTMMMNNLVRQEVGWYDREENSSSAIIARLEADAYSVKGRASDTFGMYSQILGSLLAGIPISFVYQWQETLILLAILPVTIIIPKIGMRLMQPLLVEKSHVVSEADSVAMESTSNYKVVSVFNLQTPLCSVYKSKMERVQKFAVQESLTQGVQIGLVYFISFSAYALTFWYAGQLTLEGKSSINKATSSIVPMFMAFVYISTAQQNFPDVAKGKVAVQRVFAIIDRKPKIDNVSNTGVEPKESAGSLTFKAIKFYYPARPDVLIFENLDLELQRGKSLALVGPSGCGKSTIVGLTLRFYDPIAGTVLMDGTPLPSLNIHWLRSQIGLVGQEPVLFSGTLMENIKYGRPDATDEECKAAASVANASGFINELPSGFDTLIGDQQIQLSGGQKQRIAIARAIVRNPKILMLDEATSALDATSERVVQDALDAAMIGRSGLIIAHRLATVRNVDTIVVLDRGNIVEKGSHSSLMAKNGKYAAMVELQNMN
ncbi:putative ABC transporter B family member 4 [Nannochloris sp. 'desiccata']|nr:putative ABC transporter B family member 4 [Chlorella desiccata (nom. nud.)]